MLFSKNLAVVRGAGDLATGVIYRLHQCGFPVIATETSQPLAIRRTVAFAQAVFTGTHTVEGVTARRVDSLPAAMAIIHENQIPVLPHPGDEVISMLQPQILVDARLLKRSDAAHRQQAPLVIGLGPGFSAGVNCHAVIETKRGHTLGRVYWDAPAEIDTGMPGAIAGYQEQRLLRAPVTGHFQPHVEIGAQVVQGSIVADVLAGETLHPISAPISGVVRGLLYPELTVTKGMKVGDIDPRNDPTATTTISDKSLAIGGAVLVAILTWLDRSSPGEEMA